MGSVYRKMVTRPVPNGCKIITRKNKQLAQWTSRRGRTVTAELNEAGDRIRCETGTYLAKYRDGDGIVRELSTGCRDKAAAANVLADLEKQAELVRSKILTSDQSKIAEHADTLLDVHVADYIDYLKLRKVHPARIKTTETRLKETSVACGWRYLRDLSSDTLQKWLAGQVSCKIRKMSAATFNQYVAAWVSCGHWLVGKRLSGKRPSCERSTNCILTQVRISTCVF